MAGGEAKDKSSRLTRKKSQLYKKGVREARSERKATQPPKLKKGIQSVPAEMGQQSKKQCNYHKKCKSKAKKHLAKLKLPAQAKGGLSRADFKDGGGCMSTALPIDRHRKLCYGCCREVQGWTHARVQPVCQECGPKIQAGDIPEKHVWTLFSLFTGSSSVMFPLCEQVARSLIKPFILVYSADSSESSRAVSAGIARTSSIYKTAKANALVYDVATVDVSYLPPCTMGIVSPPCQMFSRLGNREGLADDVTMILHQQLLSLVRLQKFKVLAGEEVADYFTNEAFAQLRQVAEECGYCVQWKKLDTKDLNLPTSRTRGFFSMVHELCTSWDQAVFEQNYDAAHVYETQSQLELPMCVLSRGQYKTYFVTDVQLEKCKAARVEHKDKIREALREAGISPGQARNGWYVLDLSVSDYRVVSSLEGIIQCITTVNAKRLYCTHHSMERCFLVQELAIALGFEATPLRIICKALGLEHAGGAAKLGKMLGQCASPACWRVFLGAVIETLKAELFAPDGAPLDVAAATPPCGPDTARAEGSTGPAAPVQPVRPRWCKEQMAAGNWLALQESGQKVSCLHNDLFYRVKVKEVCSSGTALVQYNSDNSFEEVSVGRLILSSSAVGQFKETRSELAQVEQALRMSLDSAVNGVPAADGTPAADDVQWGGAPPQQ